ncbi:hypothetical protein FF100_04720 [Methylobacterium terricola]|uniref:Uncharacterized protein n=1 Tax=Methylobacterium terricola TaxID=2583531 RepID=A0A5C4LLQ7_9HYPH|nr:hypothetical protein [Methylobacterium terricola]TNC14885.1 hypothetical protein FF100_04720 [Methylobacterium terricola]
MSAAFRRPKLTHMPHQVFAREERAAQRLEQIAQHDEHFCGHCGVAGASRGFKRPGWAHVRDEAIWACFDAECLAWAENAVDKDDRQGSEAA